MDAEPVFGVDDRATFTESVRVRIWSQIVGAQRCRIAASSIAGVRCHLETIRVSLHDGNRWVLFIFWQRWQTQHRSRHSRARGRHLLCSQGPSSASSHRTRLTSRKATAHMRSQHLDWAYFAIQSGHFCSSRQCLSRALVIALVQLAQSIWLYFCRKGRCRALPRRCLKPEHLVPTDSSQGAISFYISFINFIANFLK